MFRRWIDRQEARYSEAARGASPSLGVRLAAARKGSPSLGVWRVIVGILFLGLCLADIASRLAGGSGVKVNAWPLDEGLIDYVACKDQDSDNPLFAANVIANKSLMVDGKDVDAGRITVELLRETLHEAGGVRANVAWGQDLNGTGPGAGWDNHLVAALFLASDEANFITGISLLVDGGGSLRRE